MVKFKTKFETMFDAFNYLYGNGFNKTSNNNIFRTKDIKAIVVKINDDIPTNNHARHGTTYTKSEKCFFITYEGDRNE